MHRIRHRLIYANRPPRLGFTTQAQAQLFCNSSGQLRVLRTVEARRKPLARRAIVHGRVEGRGGGKPHKVLGHHKVPGQRMAVDGSVGLCEQPGVTGGWQADYAAVHGILEAAGDVFGEELLCIVSWMMRRMMMEGLTDLFVCLLEVFSEAPCGSEGGDLSEEGPVPQATHGRDAGLMEDPDSFAAQE